MALLILRLLLALTSLSVTTQGFDQITITYQGVGQTSIFRETSDGSTYLLAGTNDTQVHTLIIAQPKDANYQLVAGDRICMYSDVGKTCAKVPHRLALPLIKIGPKS